MRRNHREHTVEETKENFPPQLLLLEILQLFSWYDILALATCCYLVCSRRNFYCRCCCRLVTPRCYRILRELVFARTLFLREIFR